MLAGASKFPGVPSNTHCFQRTSTHRYKSQRATGTILFRAIESGSQGLTQVLTGFRERGGSASVPVCGHLLGVCLWHRGGQLSRSQRMAAPEERHRGRPAHRPKAQAPESVARADHGQAPNPPGPRASQKAGVDDCVRGTRGKRYVLNATNFFFPKPMIRCY